jgi:hypothetical protein
MKRPGPRLAEILGRRHRTGIGTTPELVTRNPSRSTRAIAPGTPESNGDPLREGGELAPLAQTGWAGDSPGQTLCYVCQQSPSLAVCERSRVVSRPTREQVGHSSHLGRRRQGLPPTREKALEGAPGRRASARPSRVSRAPVS